MELDRPSGPSWIERHPATAMGRQDQAVRRKESSGDRDQERLSGGHWKKREGRRDGVTGEELQEQ